MPPRRQPTLRATPAPPPDKAASRGALLEKAILKHKEKALAESARAAAAAAANDRTLADLEAQAGLNVRPEDSRDTAGSGLEFKSVLQAKHLRNWATPGGFRDAVKAEIDRVTSYYKAARLVGASRLREARAEYGREKVNIQHTSMPGK